MGPGLGLGWILFVVFMDPEDCVVYDDGPTIRRVHGTIIRETPETVTLERRDGTVEIARRVIRKIERARNGGR